MLIPTDKRKPPFHTKVPARGIRLTERDAAILQHLAEHRFLRSSHIRALVGFPSARSCQERLKELREAGYLQLIQPRYGDPQAPEGGGKSPAIHALGNKGAGYLAERLGVWMSPNYNENNRRAGDKFIDHDLACADFMINLELQCRLRRDVELIAFYDILQNAPEDTKQDRKQRQWPIVVEWQGNRRSRSIVTPDQIFGLRNLSHPAGHHWTFYFLEVDRSNETINPKKKRFPDTSIFNKMLEYAFTYRDQIHKTRYNLPNFRVLFVTGGPRITHPETRVRAFIETFEKEIRPVDISRPDRPDRPKRTPRTLFLFTDDTSLDAHARDYFSLPWLDARGERVTLLD